MCAQYRIPSDLSTVAYVAVDERAAHTHSDAVLRVAALLPPPWSLARHCLWVPACIRNAVYRFVAYTRYWVWGKRSGGDGDACGYLPGLRARMLDDVADPNASQVSASENEQ